MSLSKIETIKCYNCKNEFDIEIYDSINSNLNPDLKKRIINDTLPRFKCPTCKKFNTVYYPFLYHDMQNKYMIKYDNIINVLDFEEEVENNEFKNTFMSDYEYFGALSFEDLRTIIISKENNLNPKIVQLIRKFLIKDINYRIENKEIESIKECLDVIIKYINNDPIYELVALDNDDRLAFYNLCNVQEMYEDMSADIGKRIEGIKGFTFSLDLCDKFLSYSDSEYNDSKEFIYTFFKVKTNSLNEEEIVYALPINYDKYKVGDEIIYLIYDDNNIPSPHFGVIEKIIKKSDLEFPLEIDDLPIIGYKIDESLNFKNKTPKEEYNNEKIFNIFKNLKEDKGNVYEELLNHASDISLELAVTSDEESDYKVLKGVGYKHFFATILDSDILLNTYIGEVKDNKKIERIESYSFYDIIRIFLNNNHLYTGISIEYNGKHTILSYEEILNIIYHNVMLNKDKMKELLLSLTDEEISFVGEMEYEAMKAAYITNTFPDFIKKHEDVKESLSYAYSRIKRIILSRLDLSKEI